MVRKQGHMKIWLMQILKYFTEINNLELIQNTLFMDVEKNIKLVCQQNFQCLWMCPIEPTKTFFSKMKNACGFLSALQ